MDSRKEGLFVYYRLADPAVFELSKAIRTVAERQLADLDRLVRQHFEDRADAELVEMDELLKRLSGREEAILRLRYGFYDDKMHTLAETGEQFGLSRERIRQLEQRALMKLRQLIDAAEIESASVH